MTILSAMGLSYRADERALVDNASFQLGEGGFTMLIGPNGSGKTTLLRLALGLLRPAAGRALLCGKDMSALPAAARARSVAYLPQGRSLAWPQPVRDVVALGRFAHGGAVGQLAAADRQAIEMAMQDCGLTGFENRAVDTLSGGELARVHIARALAGQAPLLMADEPIAALDPHYQHDVMQLFRTLSRSGRTVLSVVHDLGLAALYADRLIWMQGGRIVADGSPADTMTAARLRDVFGVSAEVRQTAHGLQVDIHGAA
ncbi:ABC transporter ATP-binding protein [Pacificimonas sp. WHA3]|uniref:ABC transporter ATP-binding protein n=1 Tax=Pacificimonas pallii TaxID=2827236 RepID=A0ABS6SH91_9SPHN|nr:ABC transporter ATP-binding protein [Pacificimonas pallii]MBV7257782.1 ABC transporter ATP-binding protein [Pacificimonas pallii]